MTDSLSLTYDIMHSNLDMTFVESENQLCLMLFFIHIFRARKVSRSALQHSAADSLC